MRRILSFILLASLLLSVLALAGCDVKKEDADDCKPIIVCSIFPQYDFVRQIVGDKAEVILLQKNGTDMHSFEPTPSNILDICRADIFVVVDRGAEGWVDGVLEAAGNNSLTLIEMSSFCHLLEEETPESIRGDHSHSHDHDHGDGDSCTISFDEHMWMSIENVVHTVEGIKSLLCEKYPLYANDFCANADAYIEKLEALDGEFAALNLEGEKFIVADRFPFLYLAKEYGLDYLAAFPGCSDQTHSSFEVMTYLIGEVKENNVRAIFKTEDENVHIAEQLSDSTGAEIYTLYSCQSITKAQLDAGESYISLMRKNLETMKEAYCAVH